MSVASRLLHPDDQKRLDEAAAASTGDDGGKAQDRGVIRCDLQADFSLQPWYYVEEEQPVATLSYLPRSLRLVRAADVQGTGLALKHGVQRRWRVA